jgi:hypothetical protein
MKAAAGHKPEPSVTSPVLRFLFVVGVGIVGGVLCGILINLPFWIHAGSLESLAGSLTALLFIGAMFGAPFGAIAFPFCYYLFLTKVPLRLALAVTIPCTVVAGWFTYLPFLTGFDVEGLLYIVLYYVPGFLGLLLSSMWLSVRARDSGLPGSKASR